MAYSTDADLEKYDKRVLELSSDGTWTDKHDLATDDIDLRLTAKGIDPDQLTADGVAQLKKAACFRTLYHVFDELSSLGSEAYSARRDSFGKRFMEEFELQITVGLDTEEDTGAEQVSKTIRLRR